MGLSEPERPFSSAALNNSNSLSLLAESLPFTETASRSSYAESSVLYFFRRISAIPHKTQSRCSPATRLDALRSERRRPLQANSRTNE